MITLPPLFLQLLHLTTLPGAAGLFCVLVFMIGERRRGQLMMLSLSAAVSLNLLLKEFFKVPRPWAVQIESVPFLAEGGYALPCLHVMLTSAMSGSLALTSKRRSVRFLYTAWVWLVAVVRVLTGLQSILDVLAGAAAGLLIAFVLGRFWFAQNKNTCSHRWCISSENIIHCGILLLGLIAALVFQDGWGLGTGLTVIVLTLLEKPFQKAETGRTTFGKIYGTVFAGVIYAGLFILLPFLIEWLITPLWPGQTLIVLLITLIPCLLRLFPLF